MANVVAPLMLHPEVVIVGVPAPIILTISRQPLAKLVPLGHGSVTAMEEALLNVVRPSSSVVAIV